MQAYVVIVLGKRGAGKSRMLYRCLVPRCTAPAFVLDSLGGDVPYGIRYKAPLDMAESFAYGENHSGVYILDASTDKDCSSFFSIVHEIGKQHDGKITLVVDEVDKYTTTHKMDPELDQMIRYGRRYGIDCLFASRRVGEINVSIRSQVDCFISFNQTEPSDIKAIKDRSSEAARAVTSLELWRNTQKESEFIIIGELPNNFLHLEDRTGFVPLF